MYDQSIGIPCFARNNLDKMSMQVHGILIELCLTQTKKHHYKNPLNKIKYNNI